MRVMCLQYWPQTRFQFGDYDVETLETKTYAHFVSPSIVGLATESVEIQLKKHFRTLLFTITSGKLHFFCSKQKTFRTAFIIVKINYLRFALLSSCIFLCFTYGIFKSFLNYVSR